MKMSRSGLLALVMVFYGIGIISPILPHFGIRGSFVTLGLFAVLFVAYNGKELCLDKWSIFLILTLLILACAPSLYWLDARYAFSPIFLIFALFLLQLSDTQAMDRFLTIATGLMLVLLVGGIIGFVLASNGVQPLFEISNSDGKSNFFFYTTFSRLQWGNIIRPAGIFDEPGAFSFMICAVCALRHLYGRDSRVTWLLLGAGFLTLSLAHLVYVIIHAMAENFRLRNLAGIIAMLIPIILLAGYLGGFETVEKRLISRATISETGEIVGDNRSWRMLNAATHLSTHPESILFGADPACRFDPNECAKKFPMMGENPLSPLAMHGAFISWPYYLVLAILFTAPIFGRQYIVSLAFGALLLQRPYVTVIGYSLISVLVVATTISCIAGNHHGKWSLVLGRRNAPA
jgi:hypothetical protein